MTDPNTILTPSDRFFADFVDNFDLSETVVNGLLKLFRNKRFSSSSVSFHYASEIDERVAEFYSAIATRRSRRFAIGTAHVIVERVIDFLEEEMEQLADERKGLLEEREEGWPLASRNFDRCNGGDDARC